MRGVDEREIIRRTCNRSKTEVRKYWGKNPAMIFDCRIGTNSGGTKSFEKKERKRQVVTNCNLTKTLRSFGSDITHTMPKIDSILRTVQFRSILKSIIIKNAAF